MDRWHGDFLRYLGEKGGDVERFRRALIERQMITSDILAVGKAQGIDILNREASKPLWDLLKRSMAEYAGVMKASVGPDDYWLWTEFEKARGEHYIAAEMNRRLAGTGSEMTGETRDALVKILFEAFDDDGRKNNLSLLNEEGFPTLVRVIPESALARAGAVLDPTQAAKLAEIYQEQRRSFASLRH